MRLPPNHSLVLGTPHCLETLDTVLSELEMQLEARQDAITCVNTPDGFVVQGLPYGPNLARLSESSQTIASSSPLMRQDYAVNSTAASTSPANSEPEPMATLPETKPKREVIRRISSTLNLDQVEISSMNNEDASSVADDEDSDDGFGFERKRSMTQMRRNAFSQGLEVNELAPAINFKLSKPKRKPLRRSGPSYRLQGFMRDSDHDDEEVTDYLKSITVPPPTKQSDIFKTRPEIAEINSPSPAAEEDGNNSDWLHPDAPVITLTRPSGEEESADVVRRSDTETVRKRNFDTKHLVPPPRLDTRRKRDAANSAARKKERRER
ncbi:hypothetical protein K490DRAFT_56471 [Saccharata proteae CBS 121410]|uniref:Uncharacterized protein n=1 Tax=Saccharata proteae CBS 121410 TaxID=1314787 RepID=A0A9P4HTS9_9PEZI|nr:hypothetical protein K490DRAFT_56471 [Saccharata proteae CBS 121410]